MPWRIAKEDRGLFGGWHGGIARCKENGVEWEIDCGSAFPLNAAILISRIVNGRKITEIAFTCNSGEKKFFNQLIRITEGRVASQVKRLDRRLTEVHLRTNAEILRERRLRKT